MGCSFLKSVDCGGGGENQAMYHFLPLLCIVYWMFFSEVPRLKTCTGTQGVLQELCYHIERQSIVKTLMLLWQYII